jgi:hypothetical protein
MKLSKYEETKHDVSGFVFGGWTPTHVAMKGKKVQAVLLTPPENFYHGSDRLVEHMSKTKRSTKTRKKLQMSLRVLRPKATSQQEPSTVIAWPDSVSEAEEKLRLFYTES